MHTYVKDALDYLNGKNKPREAILSGLVLLDSNGNLTVRNLVTPNGY